MAVYGSKTLKRMPGILVLLILVLVPAAAGQLHVPPDHGVYEVLRQLEMRELIPPQSGALPYTESYIVRLLDTALTSPERMSAPELTLLQAFRSEFGQAEESTRPNSIERVLERGSLRTVDQDTLITTEAGIRGSLDFRLPSTSFQDYDLRSAARIYYALDIGDTASVLMEGGLRFDKLDPTAFSPYRFSTPGEGFYLWLLGDSINNAGYYNGQADFPVAGFDLTSDLSLSLLDHAVEVGWGMYPRNWGFGTNGILLSGTARSFDALSLRLQPADWLVYSYLSGTLTPKVLASDSESDKFQNMVGLKRLELLLPFNLKLAVFETVVYVKRFELGYLNPFMVSMLYQNILGDYDNMLAGVEFEYTLPLLGRVYGSFAFDELHHANPVTWFKEARDIIALQAGAEFPLPVLPFSSAQLQYTHIAPFFYTHYPQNYPTYDFGTAVEEKAEVVSEGDNQYVYITIVDDKAEMNVNYLNKGEPLGYYLPPNSDELLLHLSSHLSPDLSAELTAGIIRHSGQYGDSYEEYMDYGRYSSGGYAQKDFQGNLVGKAYTAALRAEWKIPASPAAVTGGYQFSYEMNRDKPDDPWTSSMKHLFSAGVRLYL
jgi:hypothetical protein